MTSDATIVRIFDIYIGIGIVSMVTLIGGMISQRMEVIALGGLIGLALILTVLITPRLLDTP